MVLNDTRRDGQPQSRAGVLGGKERVEQALFDFGRNAFAGVRDFKDDDVRLAVGKRFPVPPGAQRDCAVVGDAVGGVLHEIDQHLLDLRGVHPDSHWR